MVKLFSNKSKEPKHTEIYNENKISTKFEEYAGGLLRCEDGGRILYFGRERIG